MNANMNNMKNKEFLEQDESNDIFNNDEDDSNENYEVLPTNAFKQPDPLIQNLSYLPSFNLQRKDFQCLPLPEQHQDCQPQSNEECEQPPQMNLLCQTSLVNSSNQGNHQNSNYHQLPKQDLGQNYDYQPLFLTRDHQLIKYPPEIEIVNFIDPAIITKSSSSDGPVQQLEEENVNSSVYFGEGVSRSQIVSDFTPQEQNQECLNYKKSLNSLGQDNGLIQEKEQNQNINKSLPDQWESKKRSTKMIQQTPGLLDEMCNDSRASYPDLCVLPLQLPNYEDPPYMETRAPSNTIDHQNGNGDAVNQTTITADQSFSIQLKKQKYLSNQYTEQNQQAPLNDEKHTINYEQKTETKGDYLQPNQHSMINHTTKLIQSSKQQQPIQSIQLPFLLPPPMINSYKSPPDRSAPNIDTFATKNIQCSNSENQIQNFQLPITPENTPSDKAKIFSSNIYKKEDDKSTHFKSSGVSPSFSHIHSSKYKETPQQRNRPQSQISSPNSTNSGKQFTANIAATKTVQPNLSRSSTHLQILPTQNVTQINQTIKEDVQMQLLQLPNPFLTINEKYNSSNSQHDLSIFQMNNNNNNELNQQQQQNINSSQNPFFPSKDTQQQMQLKFQRKLSSQQPEGSIFLDSYKHHQPAHNQNPKQISLSESPENSFFWKPQKKIRSSIFNSKQNLYSPQCSIIQQQSQKQEPFSQLSLQDSQPQSIANLSLAFNQNNISLLKQNQYKTPPPQVSYPNSTNQQFQPRLLSSPITNYFENPIKFSNEQQKTMFSPSEENLSQFKQLFNNIQNLEQPNQPILNQHQHQQLLPEQNTFDQNQSNLYSNQSECYFHQQHLFQQNQVQNSKEQKQRQNSQKQQHYQNVQQQKQQCQLQQQQQYQQQPYQQQQQNEQLLQQLQQLQQQQQQEIQQPQLQILEQQMYEQQGFPNQSQGNYQIMQTQKLPDYMGCFPTKIQSKDPNQQRKMNEELQMLQYGLNTAQAYYGEQKNNQKSNDLINNYDLQNPYLQPQIMLDIEQRQIPNLQSMTEQSQVIPNNYTEPIQHNNNKLKPWGIFKQNLYPQGYHEQTLQATNQHQQAITLMPQQNPQLFRNAANNVQEFPIYNQIQNMPLSIAALPSVFHSTHNGEYLKQNHNHLQIDQGIFNQKQLEILNDVKPQQNRLFKNASFDSNNEEIEDEELGLVINDEQNNDWNVKMKNSTKKSHINLDMFENICENSTFAPKSKSKNETKNIPKNYAKAFLRYILDKNQKNEVERIISSIMRSNYDPSFNLTYEDIRQASRKLKITMNAIKDVRKIWFDDTNTHSKAISKFMRIASHLFLQKEAISYIFSSNKIKNSKPHIIYRHVMQLAICDPSKFNNIKNIYKNAYNVY